MQQIAQPLKLQLHQFGATIPSDFAGLFAAMNEKRIGAVVVLEDAVLLANAGAVAAEALAHRQLGLRCFAHGWASPFQVVTPAKAGVQGKRRSVSWIPVFAGMTT